MSQTTVGIPTKCASSARPAREPPHRTCHAPLRESRRQGEPSEQALDHALHGFLSAVPQVRPTVRNAGEHEGPPDEHRQALLCVHESFLLERPTLPGLGAAPIGRSGGSGCLDASGNSHRAGPRVQLQSG